MTDYDTSAQARQCLVDNKLRYIGQEQGIQLDQYLDGYSAICAFLSRNADFERALTDVSRRLWHAYLNDPSQSNKFTRALSVVSSQLGFSVRQNYLPTVQSSPTRVTDSSPMKFKLTGNDSGLGFFLRNKLFWKDSMEALHGEHSHSLQWLAIAVAKLDTALPIPQLYSQSGAFVMSGTDSGAKTSIHLWAWLADSFPPSMSKFGDVKVLAGNKDNLTTNSYRSPQNITSHLVPLAGPINGHFVSHYLYYRYDNRKWIKGNIGGSIGGYARAKADTSPAWKQSQNQANRFIRTNFTDAAKNRADAEFIFHGRKGNLYNTVKL